MMSEVKKDDLSNESEINPMEGVREIKGADTPIEPKEHIDIEKHKDGADPDSKINEAVTPLSSDKVIPAPVSKPQKKARNWILIILLILCFLCLFCCVGTYALRDQFFALMTNSSMRTDPSLKQVTTEDIKNSNSDLGALLEQKKAEGKVNSTDGQYSVVFTEKELLTSIFKNIEGVDPTSIALKFETGKARFQVDIGKIIESQKANIQNSPELQNLPVPLEMLNGLILSGEVVTNTDGTKLSIQNLTTGNSVIDALIPQEALTGLENQIDLNNLVDSESGSDSIKVEKVEFLDGQVNITVRE